MDTLAEQQASSITRRLTALGKWQRKQGLARTQRQWSKCQKEIDHLQCGLDRLTASKPSDPPPSKPSEAPPANPGKQITRRL